MTKEQLDALEEFIMAIVGKMDRASQDCDHFRLMDARKDMEKKFCGND